MLGNIKLNDLKPIHIQNYVDDLVGILSPQTIKIHINILNLALKRAYKLKLVKYDIVDCIEVPKNKKFKSEVYDQKDIAKLLGASAQKYTKAHSFYILYGEYE